MKKMIRPFLQILFVLSVAGLGNRAFTQPVITSFSPGSGSIGTLVTISGTSLNNLTAFTIGGQPAIVVSNTGSTLVGMIMPGAITGPVSVSTNAGTFTATGTFTVISSPLPTVQQGSRLWGSGVAGTSFYQGRGVAVSADGNSAIIGGPYDNSYIGAAWILTRTGTTWSQESGKLTASDNTGASRQGWSVALSADGNTAIVGGYNDNNGRGGVWIYNRIGDTWYAQSTKLVGTGYVGTPNQGKSVSLSADGNTAIVGGDFDNNYTGAAWIFTRNGNEWTQQGNKLVGTGYSGSSQQGSGVSLSADGNTAIIGATGDNGTLGAAWIFTRNGNTWTQQGSKLVGTGYTGYAHQGSSVSLSADGKTAAIGGYTDNNGVGATWIFTSNGSSWTQQGGKLVGTGYSGSPGQGISVSLCADGNMAIAGGYSDNNNRGAAWIFTRSGSSWTQQGGKLVGTGYTGTIVYQGMSVCMSADGSTAIVGGPGDDNGKGAAWVFTSLQSPIAVNASNLLNDSFTAGWNPSDGATGYYLDVSTSNTFESFITGYNNKNVGLVNSYTVTGLTAGATYYYRVRATNGSATSASSNSIMVTTTGGGKNLNLKVFLEGPLAGTTMNTGLKTAGLLPLSQPFAGSPWLYPGTETVTNVAEGVVDWILVELRQADLPANATSTTSIARRAAFLKSDGSITDLDGTSPVRFADFTLPGGNSLFVVIRHRSHLAIMSAAGAAAGGGGYSYDFTTGLSQAYGGGSGYKQVGTIFAMVTGDIDQDGSVFVSDYNAWAGSFGGTAVYNRSDLDLDGSVFVSDYNKWAAAFGVANAANLKSLKLQPKYTSCVPE